MAPVTATASERAPKRQRGGKNSDQGVYAQWADVPVQGDPRLSLPNSHSARRSRHGRDGSASSGYNSPGYSHSHSPYGQQSPSIPGGGQSVMRDPNMYSSHSHTSSPEYEGEEEEPVDHGPTELPPRSYSGKSKYDPPKKPGKIPGSAMDYVRLLSPLGNVT
ncbi:hypothetical protein K439DRAFT_1617059 [Ramaria rubella]|nr:hypothetical protein K439DRAFT_1617059 [Ramaria rubella]